MKKNLFVFSFIFCFLLGSCSKGDNAPNNNSEGSGFPAGYAAGAFFYKIGTQGIKSLNLNSGMVKDIIPNWSDGSGWDISWDGTKGVKVKSPSSNDARTHYIIFQTSDGATVSDIAYVSSGGHAGGLPYFSPDGTKLALRPTFDDGLVILDMKGNVLKNISGYGADHDFKFLDNISWDASGAILFKKNGALWRTTTDFSRASKVRDIPYDDWTGYTSASPDGKKIALSAGNHIYVMNSDGSDFHAVTSSDQRELFPAFSPDSKYIAMKANSRAPMEGDIPGNTPHLCVIPADGQVYKVWPGEDNKVIHPREKGKTDSRGLGMAMTGDFVWR